MELDGADVARPTIENLVFRGGGVKGIAYCGALKVLSDLNLLNNVKRYLHILKIHSPTLCVPTNFILFSLTNEGMLGVLLEPLLQPC